MTEKNKNTIAKIVDYMYESEQNHLLEELFNSYYDEEDDDRIDFDTLTEQELYAFCDSKKVDHIWTSVYELKQLLEDLP